MHAAFGPRAEFCCGGGVCGGDPPPPQETLSFVRPFSSHKRTSTEDQGVALHGDRYRENMEDIAAYTATAQQGMVQLYTRYTRCCAYGGGEDRADRGLST